MKARVDHYIKPNEGNRVPRRHVFVDVEWKRELTDWGEKHTFRLACARFYAADSGRKKRDWLGTFQSPLDLWRAISEFANRRSRTVVWCHNLGHGARISESLPILPTLNWELASHNFTSRGTWFIWKRGQQTLCLVDSSSVFSQPLNAVGKWFRLGKVPVPRDCDDMKRWEIRTARNVEILSTAVLAYLDWLETADMGNWQMTGAGQSWAAFRHKHLTHNMLVHTDKEALAAERRAMWTGRNEAYWHGEMKHETIEEWDFHLSYASIARDSPVPVRLVGDMPVRYKWRDALDNPRIGLLAEVTVTTDTPCVPTLHDSRIVWPTGTFDTTLWDPEIKAALSAGAVVTVRRGWLYRTEPAMAQWGHWIIDLMAAPDAQVPAWQKDVLKNWCRTVVGRPAMQFAGWEVFAHPRSDAIDRWDYFDTRTGENAELLQVGRKVWKSTGMTEWAQSMPMVTGYVMSVARVKLSALLSMAPKYSVLYADTDSVLTSARFHSEMATLSQSVAGKGLRLKRSYEGVTIWGPRQIVTGPIVRVSGVAHGAQRVASRTFTGQIHESIGHAVKSGNIATVEVTDRTWTVKGVDNRRRKGEHGWTHPLHIGADRAA